MVKSVSGGMLTHIAQDVTTLARCWKIVRNDGSVAATGVFTGVTNFADADTITIGTRVYTFQTTLTAGDGHIHIGALLADSLTNLANAINKSGGTPGTDYNVSIADPNVTAVATSTTVTVTDIILGVSGDTVATTTTSTHGAWGGATLTGGVNTTFRFTSHDADLTIAGDGTYISSAGFSNSAIQNKSDFSVDNQEVQGVFDDASITLTDLRAGAFDYADIYIFMVNWQDTTTGPIKIRRGKLGEVVSSPQGWFTVELRGMTQLFQQQIVELCGPNCRADVFDARCALDKTSYTSFGHVASVTDQENIVVVLDSTSSIYSATNGWFQYGILNYLTGLNKGKAIEVKAWDHTANTLQFYITAGYPITIGDTFSITPGCDKSRATCKTVFNNVLNFRGEPDLPGNDAAYNYPDLGAG